ncbi:MAG: hypothetical protein ABSE05_16520 [Syntrophales bacterium]
MKNDLAQREWHHPITFPINQKMPIPAITFLSSDFAFRVNRNVGNETINLWRVISM